MVSGPHRSSAAHSARTCSDKHACPELRIIDWARQHTPRNDVPSELGHVPCVAPTAAWEVLLCLRMAEEFVGAGVAVPVEAFLILVPIDGAINGARKCVLPATTAESPPIAIADTAVLCGKIQPLAR